MVENRYSKCPNSCTKGKTQDLEIMDMTSVLRKFGIDPDTLVSVPLIDYNWNKFRTTDVFPCVDNDVVEIDKHHSPSEGVIANEAEQSISQCIRQLRSKARRTSHLEINPG